MSRADLSTENLIAMVQELNGWDDTFEHLEVFENGEQFFEDFFDGNVDGAVRAVCYGGYNYIDDYVRFNGYGNLDTLSEYDYELELDNERDNIVDHYIKLVIDGDLDNGYIELDNEIEEIETGESGLN